MSRANSSQALPRLSRNADSAFGIGATLFVALLLGLLNYILPAVTYKASQWYVQPTITTAYIKSILDYPSWIVIPVLVVGVVLFCYLLLRMSWARAADAPIKWFVLFVAALLVWRAASYPVNFLTGQVHEFDRLLLLCCWCLAVWRPVFVLPIPWLCHIFLWQFHSEIGAQSLSHPSMALKLLLLFSVLLTLTAFTRRKYAVQFILLAATIVLAHYWAPGFGKIKIGWHEFGQIHYMLAASYANGWLGFLDKETLTGILRIFSKLDPVIVSLTLLLETLVIIALWHRQLLRILLGLAVLFHFGVFMASGIFFWQWISIDLALIVLLYRSEIRNTYSAFVLKPRLKLLSVVLVALSPFWLNPVQLAWHDSPVSYTYRIVAIGENGERKALIPTYFSPFEYPFTQSTFSYLPNSKSLPVTWGATLSLTMAQSLQAAQDTDDIRKIIDQYGVIRFDSERAKKFDQFIKTFVINKQKSNTERRWFNAIRAPTMLWTEGHIQSPVDFSISSVEVTRVVTWFDGNLLQEVDAQLVRSIEL